ncbi:MAG: SGNH/GDSL hydrolase family protein [Actinomycetota bacterium]|nr:SGNH/GDSL hydrolase family protein [Actinomycetota bacterium]
MRRWYVLAALLAVAALALVALVLPGRGGSEPAGAGGHYLALGDSLAVGVQPSGTDRSRGYVAHIHRALREDGEIGLTNLACSGETTTSLIEGGSCSYDGADSQLEAAKRFLGANRDTTRLVTLDIGANDVTRCVGTRVDTACAAETFATVRRNLDRILRELRAAAGPRVRIVGMNYYDPFLAAWLEGSAGRTVARRSMELAREFNDQLEAVYAAYDADVADVERAFATTVTAAAPDEGARPLNVARICRWTWMCTEHRDIHANDAGYRVIARTFLAVLERE